MTFLRNVLHDLVEKRLWPVAVALIVALVAAPVVLGRSAGDAGDDVALAPANPAPAAPTAVADGQVVKLAETTSTAKVHREGKVLDPFVQHHQPKLEDPATASTPGAGESAGQTANDPVSGGTSSSGGTPSTGGLPPSSKPPAPPATQDPNADDKDLYRVSLKFGEDGAMKTYKDIKRLQPLPSANDPFFIFLGVSDDKKSAVFLVNGEADTTGDGTCQPSPDDCANIVMRKRDLQYFELQTGAAGMVQYQLEILSITKGKAKTAATAAKLRARESKAGRDELRQIMADSPELLGGWDFSKKTGLLVEKQSVSEDVANVPAAVARVASGEAPEGTATVLTVPVGAQG